MDIYGRAGKIKKKYNITDERKALHDCISSWTRLYEYAFVLYAIYIYIYICMYICIYMAYNKRRVGVNILVFYDERKGLGFRV